MAAFQRRREDVRFLTGQGRFVGDRIPQDALFAGFLRSDAASVRIVSLDARSALGMPGIVAVFTADDLTADGVQPMGHVDMPRDDGGTPGFFPQPILCGDRIEHVGEPIAMVVSRDRETLIDAIEVISVELTEVTPASGVAFLRRLGDSGSAEKGFAAAAHVIEVDIDFPRMTAAAMEPRGMIVSAQQGGGLHIVASTQNPFALRNQIAEHFDLETNLIHVEAQDVGGSFGLKGYMAREDAALTWAARRLNATLVWLSSRSEAVVSDAQGRGASGRIRLAIGEDLRLLALYAEVEIDVGAYPDRRSFGFMNNANGLTGMYNIPAVAAKFIGRLSPRAPLAPFRGNGRPEATYAIEKALDHAARAIGRDPVTLRRRNLIPVSAFPITSALGTEMDCGDFSRVMDAALALACGFEDRKASALNRGRLYGVGIANCIESAGGPVRKPRPDHARLTVGSDGTVTVAAGVMSVGQGHETALSAMVSEALGIGADKLIYRNGDTRALSDGRGSGGSAGMTVAGSAVQVAVERLIEDGHARAAVHLGCPQEDVVLRDGAFHRDKSNESVGIGKLAEGGWVVETSFTPSAATFPNGTHICEVEIDPETGLVTIARYAAAEDVGHTLNPVLVKGQMHGGIAQGLSTGLGERIVHDTKGQILTGSFMDYQLVRAADLPMFELASVEVPTGLNPLGVKGVGEAGTVGATAAFGLAVGDALARAGVAEFELPATPARVWQALRDARTI